MFDPAVSPFAVKQEHERSFGAEGLPPQTTARTIYSYSSAPGSPFAGNPRPDVPRGFGGAESPFASTSMTAAAPCACTDCYPPTPSYSVSQHQRYVPEPQQHSRTPSYPPPPSLPYSSTSYGFQQPLEQPLYRPVARRPDPTPYFTAPAPPPLPSPPIEDQLPESFSYYQSTWNQPALPIPPPLQTTFPERAPLYERPAYGFQPQVSNGGGLLQPLPMKTVLDRRRSSAETNEGGVGQMRNRSISAASTVISHTSDEDQHEATTPFMTKLHYLLSTPDFAEFIRWNGDGTAFCFASNTTGLAEALGKVFRHNSAHSFVRQLNIYDFKRMTSLELHAAVESSPYPGSSLTSADYAGFSHPAFFRESPGKPCDLSRIKPKMGKKPSAKNLAAARAAASEASAARGRSLRSDGKIGGGMGARKFEQ